METPIEIFNGSEIEITEAVENEAMNIFEAGLTTINLHDIWRCREEKHKVGKNGGWGTRIFFLDGDSLLSTDKYKDIEETRRKFKALLIATNPPVEVNP